jgi:CrcB protein
MRPLPVPWGLSACLESVASQNPTVNSLVIYLQVGLGSALGGVARFWLSNLIAQRSGNPFPWGTLMVNVLGSFLIGLLASLVTGDTQLPPRYRPFVSHFFIAGICGGFTTFSAFSWQTLRLLQEGALAQALGNIAGSVFFCLIAVWIGFWVGRAGSA